MNLNIAELEMVAEALTEQMVMMRKKNKKYYKLNALRSRVASFTEYTRKEKK